MSILNISILWLRSAPRRLQAWLGDLALAVDASDEAMFGGATLATIWERNAIYATDPLCVFADLKLHSALS